MSTEPEAVFSMTFSGDAWEFFYALIEKYTEQQLAVEANGERFRLVRIEGDLWAAAAQPQLVVDNDLLANDGPVEERRIPLYRDGGTEPTFTKVHVL